MTDKKISDLTSATTPLGGTETLPIVQNGTTKNATVSDLTTGRNVVMRNATIGIGGSTNVGTGVVLNGTDNSGNVVASPTGNIKCSEGQGELICATDNDGYVIGLPTTILIDAQGRVRRVEAVEPPRLLRLRAEMKLPGRAWLQYEVEQVTDVPAGSEGATTGAGRSRLVQTAFFEPRGVWGLLYWYLLSPVHPAIFRGMARELAHRAEVASAQPGATASASAGS